MAICTLSGFGLEGREQRNRKGVSQLRNENQHVSLDELKRFGGGRTAMESKLTEEMKAGAG